MTWFDELTGFAEHSMQDVRANLHLDGTRLTSLANDRTFDVGEFSTPTLAELRRRTRFGTGQRLQVRELVADVSALHQHADNANSVFQVASQFNCLEMAAPQLTPEDGVGIYQDDRTQGPACSICAGGGTIYRNYFVNVNGQRGQTRDNQINCLSELERVLGAGHWQMQNGYCFPTAAGLAHIERVLARTDADGLDEIRGKLQVGIQSSTQVTIGDANHLVTQVFCSGLPVAYSRLPSSAWNRFPRLVLEASYESTFHVAVQNLARTGQNRLFLTLVGGGVFGNQIEWILSAIDRALHMFAWADLDVTIVSYGATNPELTGFLEGRTRH